MIISDLNYLESASTSSDIQGSGGFIRFSSKQYNYQSNYTKVYQDATAVNKGYGAAVAGNLAIPTSVNVALF